MMLIMQLGVKIYTFQVSLQKLSHSGSVRAHPATAMSLDADDCSTTFHEFCSMLSKQLAQTEEGMAVTSD